MERFLVVDDDEHITFALSKVLSSMGFDVTVHNDPNEALKESNFDVVITDFMMPNLTGVDLLRQLRQKAPDAVRLMITAASDFKVAMRAVNEGEVFRLLAKPWQLNELRAVIQQAVDYGRLVGENRRLAEELSHRNKQLTVLNHTLEQQVIERTNGLLEGMVRALDYRDTETQWHSWRVAKFTRRIAEQFGIAGDQLLHIEQGSLLHDIGKIGVRDAILLKPGPLSPEEWVEMRKHPELGWRMLSNIPYLREAALIVFQHQERWDGQGYPQKLKGREIVVGARMFMVADTLDAITSDRPYRKGSSLETALREIRRLAGTQFDPEVVEAFLSIPESDWPRIRSEVEQLEKFEKRRNSRDDIPIVG
jgi:response regulator RpfG family c-di-GMP phosphodiesterase